MFHEIQADLPVVLRWAIALAADVIGSIGYAYIIFTSEGQIFGFAGRRRLCFALLGIGLILLASWLVWNFVAYPDPPA